MSKAEIANKAPNAVEVEAGKQYYWCSCGRSQSQPFCDGSHQGTGFEPLAWTAEKTEKVWFCDCKQTGSSPLCDGTHSRL